MFESGTRTRVHGQVASAMSEEAISEDVAEIEIYAVMIVETVAGQETMGA